MKKITNYLTTTPIGIILFVLVPSTMAYISFFNIKINFDKMTQFINENIPFIFSISIAILLIIIIALYNYFKKLKQKIEGLQNTCYNYSQNILFIKAFLNESMGDEKYKEITNKIMESERYDNTELVGILLGGGKKAINNFYKKTNIKDKKDESNRTT